MSLSGYVSRQMEPAFWKDAYDDHLADHAPSTGFTTCYKKGKATRVCLLCAALPRYFEQISQNVATEKFEIRVIALSGLLDCLEIGSKPIPQKPETV